MQQKTAVIWIGNPHTFADRLRGRFAEPERISEIGLFAVGMKTWVIQWPGSWQFGLLHKRGQYSRVTIWEGEPEGDPAGIGLLLDHTGSYMLQEELCEDPKPRKYGDIAGPLADLGPDDDTIGATCWSRWDNHQVFGPVKDPETGEYRREYVGKEGSPAGVLFVRGVVVSGAILDGPEERSRSSKGFVPRAADEEELRGGLAWIAEVVEKEGPSVEALRSRGFQAGFWGYQEV